MYRGRIEVITGCMFSGKTEELVRLLRRARIAQKTVKAFKHASDDRYHTAKIGGHPGADGNPGVTFDAHPLKTIAAIERNARGHDVIGIDEAQFFGLDLVDFCERWANLGVRVIVAGLDLDSSGKPFGPIPGLMAIAETVTKLHAVCIQCGEPANRSYHLAGKVEQIEVGASQYEARCRGCWYDATG